MTAISIEELADIQKSDGAYQKPVCAQGALDGGEVLLRGQNAVWTDKTLDLKEQRIESGKIDEPERAQKDPSRDQPIFRTGARVEQPAQDVAGNGLHHVSTRIASWAREGHRG